MSRTDYTSRLLIPLVGDDREFFADSGRRLATGYDRVVIGARGPYVEFQPEHLDLWAWSPSPVPHRYFIELRSDPDWIKAYWQVHPVDYADYLPGLVYVSPFDLRDENGDNIILPLRKT